MANVGIIGWGVVGQATGQGFSSKHNVFWHDPYKEGGVTLGELVDSSEFIFVCVPTPMFADYSGIDLSIVEEVVGGVAGVIGDNKGGQVVIIKSTVVPGTTARFAEKHPHIDFVANPEFLTESRPFEDFLNPDRTIIGGEISLATRVKALYEEILPPDAVYFLTDPTSAELAKYAANAILASKIMLANEIFSVSQVLGVDYDSVRVMIEADPRIGSHLRVPGPDGELGFGGKCFPKDLVALLSLERTVGVDLSVLREVWEKNLRVRKSRDWEGIPGAISKRKD
ncbi:MAG: hypothetical protein A3H88_02090 [Candidatus Blackburnbacteria bacterium RIFCSPLOWO2_02_FULL_44_9]|nr:MAG: hypothetical protein A3H88_02090 [Candidatus Blackburnbacteria bacterium RIFCSPLOWO2_02_FULL_44_9]